MHLEPVEIQHVKLRRRPLGYDRDAVDRLLEEVTSSYEDVWFERAKLDAELAVLRNRLDGQAQAKEAARGFGASGSEHSR
jgi:DivIVA domain-containing protein